MAQQIAIRLENLAKTFGRGKKKIVAVNNINLSVETGQVYGFLGPNGAGKTTTIRMMLDLMTPTAGSISLFDQPIRQERLVLRQVGAHIEGAAFYPYLSGRRNLEVIGRINGYYEPDRIEALLKQVGLDYRAKQRFRGYSLGMKQRLGLAAALLNDPTLLIMDEPTNGLDPAGIQEMRHFLRELVEKHGKTVFFSSHLLSEVEQMCDRVAIINKGTILREGQVDALLEDTPRVRIEVAPLEAAVAALGSQWQVAIDTSALVVEAGRDDIPRILYTLHENRIDVFEVTRPRQSLETFFLSVTDNDNSTTPTAQTERKVEVNNGR